MLRKARTLIAYPQGIQEGDIINVVVGVLEQHRITDPDYKSEELPNNIRRLNVTFGYPHINYDQLGEITERLKHNLHQFNVIEVESSIIHSVELGKGYIIPAAGFIGGAIILVGMDFEGFQSIDFYDLKLFLPGVVTLFLEWNGDLMTKLLAYFHHNNDVEYLIFINGDDLACEVSKCTHTREGVRHKHLRGNVIPI